MDFNTTTANFAAAGDTYSATSLAVPAFATAVALLSWLLWPASLDPREPPLVTSWIPFVGHLIGILRYHQRYYEVLRSKYQLDIYTLRILGGRIYVVTKPDLVSAIFRNSKAFSFDPYVVIATKRAVGASAEAMEIISKPPEVEGGESYMSGAHKAMFEGLASTQELLKMEKRGFALLSKEVNNIATDGLETQWYNWVRNLLTRAAADAVFGPGNAAARDFSLVDRLWEFDDGMAKLMVDFMPSITARKPYRARKILERAWDSDHSSGLMNDACSMVRDRDENARKYGVAETEVRSWSWVMWFAPSTNSGPVAYWLLSYIFADAELLEDIRKEISKVVTISTVGGQKRVALEVGRVQNDCPLLYAAWEETLRLAVPTVSVRLVTEDTIIADKYLLKKGSTVQLPSGVNHVSSAIWGPRPEQFDPRRMLKSTIDSLPKEQQKIRLQAYWSWGGGKWKCPGQKFAIAEILPFAASMLLAFDIKMKNGDMMKVQKDVLRMLTKNVDLPAKDFDVVIKRRDEFRDARLCYVLPDGTEF